MCLQRHSGLTCLEIRLRNEETINSTRNSHGLLSKGFLLPTLSTSILFICFWIDLVCVLATTKKSLSLRSRRLEVVGERENGRVRGRQAILLARTFFLVPTTSKRLLCLLLARAFFLVPTTSKRLLCRLKIPLR